METWSEIFRSRKFWAAIIASLIIKKVVTRLTVLTSAGAIKLWDKALYVITLNSAAVRDAPYASAALNPYPVSSILLLTGAVALFGSLNFHFLSKAYAHLIRRYFRNKPADTKVNTKLQRFFQHQPSIRSQTLVIGGASIYLVAFCIAMLVPVGVESQAVSARRFYEADRDIVAPYLTSSQLVQLQADFAGIETKAQYKVLMDHLAAVAKEHHVKIHEVTW